MTSQSRGADTNEGLVVSILGQLTRLHAHQADEARVVLVPCAARTLTKTSRLHLSLHVLNFSISRPRSNVKPMIEPIGWLRTLQFVATDACVREDECVRAPLLRVQVYVGGIDLGSSDGACKKSREIGVMRLKKRLVYSSPRGYSRRTPSVRYVSDGASFCTYTAVEKELVPWHMLHHGRENVPLRHPGIVPHFETRTVNKF